MKNKEKILQYRKTLMSTINRKGNDICSHYLFKIYNSRHGDFLTL